MSRVVVPKDKINEWPKRCGLPNHSRRRFGDILKDHFFYNIISSSQCNNIYGAANVSYLLTMLHKDV